MYQLSSRITIYSTENKDTYTLDFTESVTVSSGWGALSSMATVVLPKKIYVNVNNTPFRVSWENRNLAKADEQNSQLSTQPSKKLFKEGDYIKIELGYNAELETVFEGFICGISPKVPIELECEDAMYILGKISITADKFTGVPTLEDVLSDVSDAYMKADKIHSVYNPKLYSKLSFQASIDKSMELPGFKITGKTLKQVFAQLKNDFDLETFIQDGKLYCGAPYPEKKATVSKSFFKKPEKKLFGFQTNIISDKLVAKTIDSSNLEVLVTGINQAGGKRTEVKQARAGKDSADKGAMPVMEDPGKTPLPGKDTTIVKMNVFTTVQSALQGIAQRRLSKIRYKGYSGTFTTFGKPFIKHGDEVELQDFQLPERSGKYKVKSVHYSYGSSGYRQEIELHTQV